MMRSVECWRDPPPKTSTQTVFDPALLPLLHGVCLVGGAKHCHTATPEGNMVNTIKRNFFSFSFSLKGTWKSTKAMLWHRFLWTHLVQALLSSVGQTPIWTQRRLSIFWEPGHLHVQARIHTNRNTNKQTHTVIVCSDITRTVLEGLRISKVQVCVTW